MTDPNHIAEARKKVSRPQIREVFMRNGFTIKPDRDDLHDYVYEAAFELLDSVIQQAAPANQYVAPAIQYVAPAVRGEPDALSGLADSWDLSADELYEEGRNDRADAFRECAAEARQYAAPQPAPNALTTTFQLGDHVRKTKGSQWKGRVVGTYSTTLTPEGYAVESDTEKGSVQIYPVGALELVGEDAELVEALEYTIETLDDCDMNLFHNAIEVGGVALAAHSKGGDA